MFKIKFILLIIIFLSAYSPAHARVLVISNTDKPSKKHHANETEWLAINHYVKTTDSSWLSGITNKDYFISSSGHFSPYSELNATISAINNSNKKISKEIYCRFPARVSFLKKHLLITDINYKCPEYDLWIKSHTTDSINIIYPSSYLNNPSSTFGHTFLRFDNKDKPTPLSFTVDYAAHVPEKPSFTSFISNGLSGGYQGYYSYHPYYVKTWQYSDKENRKIWEYQLTLTQEEIDRLLNHLWELRNHSIKYYFVRENCSYQILSLIKSARPSLQFESVFQYSTFPIDTIRYLSNNKLISDHRYRPTRRENIAGKYRELSESQKLVANKILHQGLSLQQIKTTLNSSSDNKKLNSFLYELTSFNMKNSKSSQSSKSSSKLLRYLHTQELDSISDTHTSERIDSSHNVGRISFGVVNRDENNATFSYRHSYHSFYDPLNFFTAGTETEVFHLEMEHENEKLRLNKLTLIRLTSIQPDELIFKPVSWQFNISSDRIYLENEDFLINSMHLAIGKSYRLLKGTFYVLPNLSVNHYSDADEFLSTGTGIFLGMLKQDKKSSLKIEARYKNITDSLYFTQYEISYSWQVNKATSIVYQYEITSRKNFSNDENKLSLSYYY